MKKTIQQNKDYVDGKMDQHEHYLMNKLSKLLCLSHNQLIEAKLKALHRKTPVA